MIIVVLLLVFTSLLLSCLPSGATDTNSSCPKSFTCPGFAPFQYPFYNGTSTSCGLIKVNCTTKRGDIHMEGGRYLILEKFDSGSSVMIYNYTFYQLLQKDEICEALMNNITSPSPLLYTISIDPFITVFKCANNFGYVEDVDDYFGKLEYKSYNRCQDYNFYYKYLLNNATLPNDLPHTCQVIPDVTNISSLLSPGFSISFKLSPSCENCHKKQGHCHISNGEFQCLDAENGKQKYIKLISVLAGSAFIFILTSAIFIIWGRYKRNPFSYVSSKNKSQDLEDRSLFSGLSVFSYTDLKNVTRNFNPSHKLGDGGFGDVYYGKLQDGREVAVKRLYEHNYKRVKHFMNEVEILTRLRHPNLVVLYGCTSQESRELLLVYEYIPNGTVADHLHGERANPSKLTWPIRLNIAIETASALVYLHASEIIHRDVKTNNILLDHNFCVKVADFGLSRLIPNNVSHVSTAPQGTPGYVDPQYHQRYQLTDKSDVYSFGVVLIELISSMVAVDLNRPPDEISLANLAMNRIQRCEFDQLIDPVLGSDSNVEIMNMIASVAELAFQCLQYESEMRPTMNEVLEALINIQTEGGTESIKDVKPSVPSKTNDSVDLLKNFPPSPVSVTGEWQSDCSASTTVSSNGERCSQKSYIST